MVQGINGAEIPKKTFTLRCPYCKQLIKRVTSNPCSSLVCPVCQKQFSPNPVRPVIIRPAIPPPYNEGEKRQSPSTQQRLRTVLALITVALLTVGVALLLMSIFLPLQEIPATNPTSNLVADSNSENGSSVVLANAVDDSQSKIVETDPTPAETSTETTSFITNDIYKPPLSTNHVQAERENIAPSPVVTNLSRLKVGLHKLKTAMEQIPENTVQPIKPRPIASIQPFGDITWDDTPLEVIKKLKVIKSLETLHLSLSHHTTYFGRYCNISPNYTDLKLRKLLRSYLMMHTCRIPGIYGNVMPDAPTITASPIAIGDGIFSLSVRFESEPGSMLNNPTKARAQARAVFGRSADFYYPIRLTSVTLRLKGSKTTPQIDRQYAQTLHKALADQLAEKYSSVLHESRLNEGLCWIDKAGHQVNLAGQFHSVSLSYLNQPMDFAQQLRTHQEKLYVSQVNRANKQRFANVVNLKEKL